MRIMVGTKLFCIRNNDVECFLVESKDILGDGRYVFTLKESRGYLLKVIGLDLMDKKVQAGFQITLSVDGGSLIFYSPDIDQDCWEALFVFDFLWDKMKWVLAEKYHCDEDALLKLASCDTIPITFCTDYSYLRYVYYVHSKMFVISSISGELQMFEKCVKGVVCSSLEEGYLCFTDGSNVNISSMFHSVFPNKDAANAMFSVMKRSIAFLGISNDAVNGIFNKKESDFLESAKDIYGCSLI